MENNNDEIYDFIMLKKAIVSTLDNLYESAFIKMNLLDANKYKNILEFNKGLGFRVFRNDNGKHKLDSSAEVFRDKEKQQKMVDNYMRTLSYVARL